MHLSVMTQSLTKEGQKERHFEQQRRVYVLLLKEN